MTSFSVFEPSCALSTAPAGALQPFPPTPLILIRPPGAVRLSCGHLSLLVLELLSGYVEPMLSGLRYMK